MNRTIAQDIARRREDCLRAIARLSTLTPTAKLIRNLRDDFGPSLADQLLAVAKLQSKARRKFGEGTWWTTDRSLQQATPWQVAALKATWLGAGTTYDLCCGVGGDSMQLATRGPVVAIDSDPLIAAMAEANLSCVASIQPSEVLCDDVLRVPLPNHCRVHIDPDRRGQSRRTSQPEFYHPSWNDVLRIVTAAQSALVKLAPAARPSLAEPSHRAWISLAGSVREQTLICGDAIEHAAVKENSVSAWIVKSDGTAIRFEPSDDACEAREKVPSSPSPQTFLIDPDPAIRASGLTEAFAARHHLMTVGGPAGFLTGEEIDTQACSKHAVVQSVVWFGSADDRKLRSELRGRNMHPATIKVRRTDHDPAILTKRYRKCGTQPVNLWIGRTNDRVFAAITVPMPS